MKRVLMMLYCNADKNADDSRCWLGTLLLL
jgi:hypothetical protein